MKKKLLTTVCILGLAGSLMACGEASTDTHTMKDENNQVLTESEVVQEVSGSSETMGDNYSTIMEEMLTGNYVVENSAYSDDAAIMSNAILQSKVMGVGTALDTKDLTPIDNGAVNYAIVNTLLGQSNGPTALKTEYVALDYITYFEPAVLAQYIYDFYEVPYDKDNFIQPSSDQMLLKTGDYYRFCPSSGDSWISTDNYVIREMNDYVLLEADCYLEDNTEVHEYVYNARFLFKITNEGAFGIQLVRVECTE